MSNTQLIGTVICLLLIIPMGYFLFKALLYFLRYGFAFKINNNQSNDNAKDYNSRYKPNPPRDLQDTSQNNKDYGYSNPNNQILPTNTQVTNPIKHIKRIIGRSK
jgi:hypothetical protein